MANSGERKNTGERKKKVNPKDVTSLVLLNQKCMPWTVINVGQKGDNIEFNLQWKAQSSHEERNVRINNKTWSVSSSSTSPILPSQIIQQLNNCDSNEFKVCNVQGTWIPDKDFDSICNGFIDKVHNLAIDTTFSTSCEKVKELERFLNDFISVNGHLELPPVLLNVDNWRKKYCLWSNEERSCDKKGMTIAQVDNQFLKQPGNTLVEDGFHLGNIGSQNIESHNDSMDSHDVDSPSQKSFEVGPIGGDDDPSVSQSRSSLHSPSIGAEGSTSNESVDFESGSNMMDLVDDNYEDMEEVDEDMEEVVEGKK